MPIFISKPYVLTCFSFVDTVIWLTSFDRVVCTSIFNQCNVLLATPIYQLLTVSILLRPGRHKHFRRLEVSMGQGTLHSCTGLHLQGAMYQSQSQNTL